MITVINNDTDKVEQQSNGAKITTVSYDLVNVKKLEYPAGTEIPRHRHDVDTLHLIIKGRMENLDGGEILEAGSKYKCGGHEYGPWKVWDDIETLVIYPKSAGDL